jgi:hypothetical protein
VEFRLPRGGGGFSTLDCGHLDPLSEELEDAPGLAACVFDPDYNRAAYTDDCGNISVVY